MAKTPRRRILAGVNAAPTPNRRADYYTPNLGPPPPTRFSPFKELGTSGYAVFGGRVMARERDRRVVGTQRWITYADMVANTSIVAAGIRYFLNIVSNSKWKVNPVDDKGGEAQRAADLVDTVINSMETPWRRVARRSAMYRFNGYGIQEWTAKRLPDSTIGFDDIEARPAHTVDRWQVDEKGNVEGVWQTSPQSGQSIYLPRKKIIYMVEDSLTDSPEGLGLYRNLVEPYERLKKYLLLEGRGFERDFRGIPIGRIPYRAISQWVASGTMTQEEANTMISGIESFVKMQSKAEDTSIVLDSAPYTVQTDAGMSISGVMQFGLELLTGQAPDFGANAAAISRLNQEMARVIGVEHLLLGGEGGANRALSEDKSRNFYLTVNGSLDEIVDACNKDVVATICDLNGIPEELRPELGHSDVSFRAVSEITASLGQMAAAGAVLAPDDPAINEVRDMLGISAQPEMTMEQRGLLMGQPQVDPNEENLTNGKDKTNSALGGAKKGGGSKNLDQDSAVEE